MDAKKTGALISAARKQKEITQRELAEKLHVSDRTVSKWERGAGFPDITMLEPLSDALGLPVHALLTGEWEERETAAETDAVVRNAIKTVYAQYRAKTKKNVSTILASLVLMVMVGFVVFAILDRSGVFLREISCEVPAMVYEGGEVVGETCVSIDGSIQLLGDRNFQGKFGIDVVEQTCRDRVSGYIRWDRPEQGFQEITFYTVGLTHVETGIQRYLYISPDMQRFALELADGRIIATDDALAKLQRIEGCRYALSYEEYPYFFFAGD